MRTQIQGNCPACVWKGSIFIGEGGYLACSRDTCRNSRLVRDMSDPVMRSRPAEGYPGRYHSVDAADIAAQRAKGWPDFHPEDFCHRCGHQNVSWYTDSNTWNPVMRGGTVDGWKWQEIVCIPCFIELAEEHHGGCTWRVARDEFGTEVLNLLDTHLLAE